MIPNFIKKYFSWLQKNVPTGVPEKYPLQDSLGQTSQPNVFVIGDLTGIPLLKLAIERSRKNFLNIIHQKNFTEDQKKLSGKYDYDIAIIGAGPAGISVAREAQKKGLSYIIIEASEKPFETIRNFPKGKAMIYEPTGEKQKSELNLQGKKKEDLLQYLDTKVQEFNLQIQTGTRVKKISSEYRGVQKIFLGKKSVGAVPCACPANRKGNHKGSPLQKTHLNSIKALRTFLAIGKSGNARKLGVEGEILPKVFNQLFDPGEFFDKNILVIGGGDSALETVISLAKKNSVTLSYRKKELSRAKAENINTVQKLTDEGKIKLLLGTNVEEIKEGEVVFKKDVLNPLVKGETRRAGGLNHSSTKPPSPPSQGGTNSKIIKNDIVFTLIGREMPYTFFKKCGITIENTWSKMTKWWLVFSLSFSNTLYFGKLSKALPECISEQGTRFCSPTEIFTQNFSTYFPQLIAWISLAILIFATVIVSYDLIKNFRKYFQTKWHFLKWAYIIFAIGVFLWAFLGSKYLGENLWGKDPYFWYGFLYTTSIGFFGLRRILTSNTRYVTNQTITLFLIQALPLFFIPNFILPWLNHFELIPEIIKSTVFLGEEWWRFVGFILAWPLFIWNVFTDQPSVFWLITSVIQTFVLIPWIVIKWGKGGYCSWICSCGAMAETVGDEYRNLSPHGKFWKKLELSGQWILFTIIIVTLLHMMSWFSVPQYLLDISKNATLAYRLIVDTFLAGTLGVGLYFFFSGRVWCRFFCPLAAFMHIIQKWGQYRIFADKKKCISCGICTKVCHMGIDVMSYAQKGKPMDDVECVRCSACVKECPMGVLSFGRIQQLWKK